MGLASKMGPCRWGVEASRSGTASSPALPGTVSVGPCLGSGFLCQWWPVRAQPWVGGRRGPGDSVVRLNPGAPAPEEEAQQQGRRVGTRDESELHPAEDVEARRRLLFSERVSCRVTCPITPIRPQRATCHECTVHSRPLSQCMLYVLSRVTSCITSCGTVQCHM